jgi:hypothetical protein
MEDRTMRTAGYLLGLLAIVTVGMMGSVQAAPTAFDTYGQPALQAINDAYMTGEIDRAQALIYRVQFIKNPGVLPERFRIDGPQMKDGTILVLEAYEELEAMGRGGDLEELRSRPTNLTTLRTTAHYIIHYTLAGSDATTESYVDAIQEACEVGWTSFHTTYGWDLPPGDGSIGGGTNMIDCYVHALGASTMGLTERESSVPPDPPNSDYTGFFHINTNISSAGERKSTVVHEYMHVVQFGYNSGSQNSWWMENCAMEASEWAYDSVNDYRGYLPEFFGAIFDPLWSTSGLYEYGQITWPMYHTERFTPDLVEDIWDRLQWGYTFFDPDMAPAALAVYGYTLEQAFHEFKTWCVYTNFRDDHNHFTEAGAWSSYYYPDRTLTAYPTGDIHPTATKRPDRLGSSINAFRPETGSTDNMLVVNYDGPACTIAVTFFHKRTGLSGQTEYYMELDADGNGTIEIPEFDVADWVLMLVSMSINCSGPEDYVFSADTYSGGAAVDEQPTGARLARIFPNYPNPVADRTALSYSLPQGGVVDVKVLDATGRVVRTLHEGEQRAGAYEIMWNRQDDAGRVVASGVYYAVLRVNGQELTRQMTVLK